MNPSEAPAARPLAYALVLLALVSAPSLADGATAGAWKFELTNKYVGPAISFQGVEFDTGVSFVCASPSYREHYFFLPKRPFKTQSTPTALTIRSLPDDPSRFFMDALRLEATGERTMRIGVAGTLTGDVKAMAEYVPLAIPAAFMQGATVVADGRFLTIGDADTVAAIGSPTKHFLIKGKYGTLAITVEKGSGLIMADRRKNMYRGKEQFLFMLPKVHPLARGDRFEHTIEIEAVTDLRAFDAKVSLSRHQPGSGKTSFLPPIKYQKPERPPALYPEPKSLQFTGGTLALPETVAITSGEFGQETRYAQLLAELFDTMGLQRETKPASGEAFIKISKIAPPAGDRYDYYELAVRPSGVSVASPTARGAYYALSTLVQLADAGGSLRTCEVKDWADFEFRGVHFIVDASSLAFHGELIRRVLAPLKFNHVVIECEYAKWPSHPEMHNAWGISPKDLEALVGVADRHFMDVTPLFQTLGHSRYLFKNKVNLDIAENPEAPTVYNVSNPRSYQVISELLADMRPVFPAARYLHIGHDEVDQQTYPSHPDNAGETAFGLFMKDLDFYRGYADRNNVKLMMWQDMLSGRSSRQDHAFYEVRDRLDKDITIVVWDYGTKDDFPEIDMFLEHGNPVIGATGQVVGGPDDEGNSNIISFSRAAKERDILGMLQTTWTGYTGNSAVLTNYPTQIWGYVQAGLSFWDTGSPFIDYYAPSWMAGAFDQMLKAQYPPRYFFSGTETMIPLNLGGVANATFGDGGGFGAGDLTTPYGVRFHLSGNGSRVDAVEIDARSPLVIPVGRHLAAASFLFAGTEYDGRGEIASITVTTDKGTLVRPLEIRREVGDIRHDLSKSGRFLSRDSRVKYFIGRPVFPPGGDDTLWQYDLALDGAKVDKITVEAKRGGVLVVAGLTLIENFSAKASSKK